MPAAPLGERRGNSRARTVSGAARPRPRRPVTPIPSKLRAARAVGVGARAAAVAAALLATLILVVALATGGRGQRVVDAAVQTASGGLRLIGGARVLFDGGFAGLGFRVATVRVEGASKAAESEIRKAAAIRPDAPILSLDLDAIRARVERVGWVGRARVMRMLPDTVVISVDQRPLAAIWEIDGHRWVVAAGGRVITGVDPKEFPVLPIIIGPGANLGFEALLADIGRHPRLAARMAWVRRVDGRRWDVLLRGHGVVMLPAEDEAKALDRLDRLDRTVRVLDLGLARIDLRNQHFTVLRPAASAPADAAAPIVRGE